MDIAGYRPDPLRTPRWFAGYTAFALCACSVSGCTREPSQQPATATARPAPSNLQPDPNLASLQDAFTQVAKSVSPSVVAIRVEARRKVDDISSQLPFPFPDIFGLPHGPKNRTEIQRGTGSGVVIRETGYVLTNAHVIENADRVEVVFRDGHSLRGKIIGTDEPTDLAVVKVEADDLVAATFADSSKVEPGQWVMAIGSPFGLDYTVTVGVVSATSRAGLGLAEIEDYLQTDASINPGNSGGPLVDRLGHVVGINTVIVGGGAGIGFAIPAHLAQHVSEQLIEHGHVERAYIGVSFQPLTQELAKQFGLSRTTGALVSDVARGGPADKAGLRAGDVIVSVDDAPVNESRELLQRVLDKKVGDKIVLGVLRQGKEQKFELHAAQRPPSKAPHEGGEEPKETRPQPGAELEKLGFALQPLTPEISAQLGYGDAQGLLVTSVTRGSPADHAGLREGDLISEADHAPVRTTSDLAKALADGSALLRVRHGEASQFVVLSKND